MACSSKRKAASAFRDSTQLSCAPVKVEGKGLLARAFQHEVDHLEGLLFVDRLRGIKRDLIVRKVKKLQRTGKW